jgi:hypothetical protein
MSEERKVRHGARPSRSVGSAFFPSKASLRAGDWRSTAADGNAGATQRRGGARGGSPTTAHAHLASLGSWRRGTLSSRTPP